MTQRQARYFGLRPRERDHGTTQRQARYFVEVIHRDGTTAVKESQSLGHAIIEGRTQINQRGVKRVNLIHDPAPSVFLTLSRSQRTKGFRAP